MPTPTKVRLNAMKHLKKNRVQKFVIIIIIIIIEWIALCGNAVSHKIFFIKRSFAFKLPPQEDHKEI